MTTLESLEAKVTLTPTPVRGAGDGMETEEPPKSVEVTSGVQPIKHHIPQNPRKKAVPGESPGVLQLGKILTEKAVEVEAIRILVPKAAITHDVPNKNAKVKSLGHHRGELLGQLEGTVEPRKELSEVKTILEKLKNSERRLLQDKEGLSNQLRVQTEVNRELKKLLVASVGDDLQYHFERLAREKNQLILENEALGQNTAQLSEQLERMSIQCDVWRSKFLASRVMADELTNSRAGLQRQNRDAQSAIQDLLSEREQFRQEMIATQKLLEELLVSLQWGREQTYYPSAQPYSTAELAFTNHKLAKAVNAHLLGNVGTNSRKKIPSTVEFCSTPAEKMAETERTLDKLCTLCTPVPAGPRVLPSLTQEAAGCTALKSRSYEAHERLHTFLPCVTYQRSFLNSSSTSVTLHFLVLSSALSELFFLTFFPPLSVDVPEDFAPRAFQTPFVSAALYAASSSLLL